MQVMDRRGKLFDNAIELVEAEVVEIQGGPIPSYVNGIILRNGPAKFDLGNNFTMNNFYDGYSMLSRFEIMNGSSVSFNKKYLDSEAYRKAMVAGRPCLIEFCTKSYADPEKNILFRHLPDVMPCFSDNGNTGIYKIGCHVFTCAETCMFQNVDPDSLKCKRKYDTNEVFGLGLMTAHPLKDPNTGIIYNIGPSMITGLKFHLLKIPASSDENNEIGKVLKEAKVLGSIPSSCLTKFAYCHSFGMTTNYVIMVEQPYQTSVPKIIAAAIRTGNCIKDFNTYDDKFKNKFIIISKATGKVIQSIDARSATSFFYYHFINCYEEDDSHVVVDIIAFPNSEIQDAYSIANLRGGTESGNCLPVAQRFIIPLIKSINSIEEGKDLNLNIKTTATAKRFGKQIILTPELLSEPGIELPTWNQHFNGKKYKYFYGTGFVSHFGSYAHSICKFNTVTKEVLRWTENESSYITEGTFIGNPNGIEEDDGVLVATVSTRMSTGQDFLLFLNAKTMKEIGRARFEAQIPLSCHGIFLSKT